MSSLLITALDSQHDALKKKSAKPTAATRPPHTIAGAAADAGDSREPRCTRRRKNGQEWHRVRRGQYCSVLCNLLNQPSPLDLHEA